MVLFCPLADIRRVERRKIYYLSNVPTITLLLLPRESRLSFEKDFIIFDGIT